MMSSNDEIQIDQKQMTKGAQAEEAKREEEKKYWLSELNRVELKRGRLDYLRFTVHDLHGIGRSQLVPRRYVEDALEQGLTFCMALLNLGPRTECVYTKELLEYNIANVRLIPAKNTIHFLPWVGKPTNSNDLRAPKRVGQVLCECYWPASINNGIRVDADPRHIAVRQTERLAALGLVAKTAFEVEFVLCEATTGQPLFSGEDSGVTIRLSKYEDFLMDLELNLAQMGVGIRGLLVEHGEGQFELCMQPVDNIEVCDSLIKIKLALKEMAQQRGWIASMMSKPFSGPTTNGLHLNQSLWSSDGKTNRFYDASQELGHSDLMRYWIGGLVKHGKAMAALCCPTINCYRRMHTLFGPHRVDWGNDNRLAAFRTKSGSHSGTYIENRLPSGACNPYLAFAATVAAGLDGIVNKIPCPAPLTKPLDVEGVDSMAEPKADGADTTYFAFNLEDALKALEKDTVIKEALGERFVRWFLQEKREIEIEKFTKFYNDSTTFAAEKQMYFEFL